MGAWGAGAFENDDAGDWVWELAEAGDTSILKTAFDQVMAVAADDLEAPECSVGLAAAEVVAALRQRPANALPEEVTDFVARVGGPPSDELVASARAAVLQIETKSELRELWDESDSREEWLEAVADLESRLG